MNILHRVRLALLLGRSPRAHRSPLRRSRAIAATFLLAASAAGCGPDATDGSGFAAGMGGATGGSRAAEPVLVRTGTVRQGEIRTEIAVTTDIEAEFVVDIFARVGPAIIKDVQVREGDRVEIDQSLLLLDDTDFRIAKARADSALAQAESRVGQSRVALALAEARTRAQTIVFQKAEQDLKRARDSVQGGFDVLSAKEVADAQSEFDRQQAELDATSLMAEQARADLDLSKLSVEAAQIELQSAVRDLEHTVVRAPIRGVVQRRDVNPGLLVNSSTHLFTLVDPTHLVANLRVAQEDLAKVHKPGLAVEFRVDALAGRLVVGHVEAVNPAVDPTSGMVRVRVRLDPESAEGVLPGMFARARVVVESRPDAVLLEKRALFYENGSPYVFTADAGTAHRHPVQLGTATASEIELLMIDGAPPLPGLEIITVGQDKLRDGDAVTVAKDGP